MPDNPPPEPDPPAEAGNPTTVTNTSGGVNLDAQHDVNIGGDVVGRDKVVSIAGDNIAGDKNIFTGDQQYDVRGLANPYFGLQSFTNTDHAKYAGREKLITETVERLTAPDDPLALLFITGASGSGKSSFVQAGVLPALKKHYVALNVKWAVFRPSRDPLAALADAVWRQLGLPQFDTSADFSDFLKTHTPPQQVNVIIIDQFEELFTQAAAQPRDALFALLTQLPPFRSTRTHIIATVRADYLPELFALSALYDIAKRGIDLRVMSVDELHEAIQQPLRAAYPDKDKRFQAELVERLAKDAAEDAAYLPLLQVTLEEIWRKGSLTLGAYTNLADAIKQRADKVLEYQDHDAAQPNQLRSPEEQAAILNLCLDLVDVSLDDEARRDVRRRRSKDELISGVPERARLIDTLTQARLLSVSTDNGEPARVEVDLIHETLLSNWDRLRQTIAERRHELRQRVRFEQQLNEWIGQNRSDGYLLSDVRLAEARELERRNDVTLHNDEAKDFVRRSVDREEARHQKELDDARKLVETERLRAEEQARSAARLRRRAIYLIGTLGVAVLLGIAAGMFGFQSSHNAVTAERNAAEAGHNASTAQAASTLAVANANVAQAASTLAVANASTAQAASTRSVSDANRRATAEANALTQRDEAQQQARIAFSRQLAAQALTKLSNRLDLALLLSMEAYRSVNTAEARSSLLSSLQFSPRLESLLRGHTEPVSSVAFSPDGKTLASGGQDGTIIWDMSNPENPMRLGEPLAARAGSVWSVAFSPDGKMLASLICNNRCQVFLWDMANLQSPVQLGAPFAENARSIAFNPNNSTLAVGGCGRLDDADHHCNQGKVTLWDMTNLQKPAQLSVPLIGHVDAVESLAYSPDGKTLASGSADGTIILWDISSSEESKPLSAPLAAHQYGVTSMAFSPDGKTLASGGDQEVLLWNVANLSKPVQADGPLTMASGGSTYTLVAFSPDGKTLASGQGHTIILWNMTSQPPLQIGTPLTSQSYLSSNVVFSPDGKTLVSGNQDSTIYLWDTTNLEVPVWLGMPLTDLTKTTQSVAFSPDGKILATGVCGGFDASRECNQGQVILWNVMNPREPVPFGAPLVGHSKGIVSLAFNPDGTVLASGSADKTIILWDVSNRQLPIQLGTPLSGHSDTVFSVAFSPDGKTLATGSNDKTIILWDVSNRQVPVQLGVPLTSFTEVGVNSVVFGPDGKLLALGGDKIVRLLDVSNPQKPMWVGTPLTGHTDWVNRVAFSPDGKTLAGASIDGTILLWDVSKPLMPVQLGVPLSSHTNQVWCVTFSPDGKTLASSGGDFKIILWDVSNPQVPVPLGIPLDGGSESISFSPNGKELATSGINEWPVILWNVSLESWQDHACNIVRRNLTQLEWQQYMGDEPYRKTCEQWPLESEATSAPTPTP